MERLYLSKKIQLLTFLLALNPSVLTLSPSFLQGYVPYFIPVVLIHRLQSTTMTAQNMGSSRSVTNFGARASRTLGQGTSVTSLVKVSSLYLVPLG